MYEKIKGEVRLGSVQWESSSAQDAFNSEIVIISCDL